MTATLPFALLDRAGDLAESAGWTEEAGRDLLALRDGAMSRDAFDGKYLVSRAIVSIDLTGVTSRLTRGSQLDGLLRLLDAQRICLPALRDSGALSVRVSGDDLTALFEDPVQALTAAAEVHRRIEMFVQSGLSLENPALACVGVGFGDMYVLGPTLAVGDEVNRAVKLGEDLARGNETLVTAATYFASRHRPEFHFESLATDDQSFPYYRASRRS